MMRYYLFIVLLVSGCVSNTTDTPIISAWVCSDKEILKRALREDSMDEIRSSPYCYMRAKILDEVTDWDNASRGFYPVSGKLKNGALISGWSIGPIIEY